MGHSHGPDGSQRPSVRAVRITTGVALAGLLATLIGALLLRPTGEGRANLLGLARIGPEYDALVDSVAIRPCSGQQGLDEAEQTNCLYPTVRILSGPNQTERRVLELPFSPNTPDLQRGDKVVLAYEPTAEPGLDYYLIDRQRKPILFWLALLFAVAVVALGRLRGLAALGGLIVTLIVLLAFVLPAVIDGRSAVLVAIVGAAGITFATLYLAHGFSSKTTTALLGTLISLGLTAALAQVFVRLAQFSGFASEAATILNLESTAIDVGGLVLAGVIIGALGALDDVTVTQASVVWELRAANPELTSRQLFHSGLRIGRDHIASTVNTLLLAYAGASLPLLIFFVVSEQSLASVANQEIVATEIVRTLVGSIGLVASVPVTTWLAARVVSTTRAG